MSLQTIYTITDNEFSDLSSITTDMPGIFKLRNVEFFSLFLLSLMVIEASGQSMDTMRGLLKEKNFNTVVDFVDKPRRSNTTFYFKTLRSIVGNYREGVIQINQTFPSNEGDGISIVENFTVYLLINNNRIFFYRIVKTEYSEDGNEPWANENLRIDHDEDSTEWDAFEGVFRQTYGQSLNHEDLFLTSIIFGEHCGYTGESTPFSDHLNKYLLDNNVDGIREWLKSANTEKQLYALKGYMILTRQGYYPTEEEKRLISIVGKKEGVVFTCSGCMYTSSDIQSVISEITSGQDEHFKPDMSGSPIVKLVEQDERVSKRKSHSWTFLVWVLASLAVLHVVFRLLSGSLRRK